MKQTTTMEQTDYTTEGKFT